ncbi:hypothetical protein TRFO_17906 [Tritrichomonas foetus]|uniref:Uncharacterized protein n=1 Tax=Tritrichomonas foetus TaxID=1144522 RepID=A0A1J4KMF3_9EUKA|nr:hypothetical protein TRFO_17906 [Tritrichomonas foetus]|eukprot:OHT12322.1 hypothetical protein TRFO_17906 [Tritrichomonas foetus]
MFRNKDNQYLLNFLSKELATNHHKKKWCLIFKGYLAIIKFIDRKMLLAIILFQRVSANCTYFINSGVWISNFRVTTTNKDDEICINISSHPFFIIFGEMPQNLKYYEYRSFNDTKRLDLYHSGTGELLPSYMRIQYPFASITISCPSGCTVSFSYGTLPSMCKTGIFFTNFRKSQISLSSVFQYEKSLASNDDKCIMFTARQIQNFNIDLNIDGTLLIYRNIYEYDIKYGIKEFFYSVNATFHPTIFRILLGNSTRSQSVSITIDNDSPSPFNEFNSFFDPINRSNAPCPETEPCNIFQIIDFELVAIIIAFLISSIIVLVALFYVLSITFCPSFVSKGSIDENKEAQTSLSPDNLMPMKGNELKGYFAMDPILRPPADSSF